MELSLESLLLSCSVQPRENIHFPNLEALHLYRPSGDLVGLCDRFSTLISFGFYKPQDAHTVMNVLQHVGQRLRRLVIDNARRRLLLVEVVRLCPNLETLRLVHCRFSDFRPFPLGLLNHLQDVHCDIDYIAPPGFVEQVILHFFVLMSPTKFV